MPPDESSVNNPAIRKSAPSRAHPVTPRPIRVAFTTKRCEHRAQCCSGFADALVSASVGWVGELEGKGSVDRLGQDLGDAVRQCQHRHHDRERARVAAA